MKYFTDLSLADLFIFKNSKQYPIYNWVYYKEGYSPGIIDWILNYTKHKPKSIFDPFCGVGTTLLRSKELSINSFGADVSPFSVLVSQIKTRNYTKEDTNLLLEYGQKLRDFLRTKGDLAEWKFELFPPETVVPRRNLTFVKKVKAFALSVEQDWIRAFIMVALTSILPQISIAVKDGGVIRVDKRKRAPDAKNLFFRKLKRMILQSTFITGPEPKIYQGSATDMNYLNDISTNDINADDVNTNNMTTDRDMTTNTLDDVFLITSPPYLNNVDYSKIYGLELSLLDFNTKQIRNQMLRSFRSKKPKTFTESKYPVVDMYFEDMYKFLETTKHNLKVKRGRIAIIVGDAVIGGEHIHVSENLAKHMEKLRYSNVELILGAERIADVKPKKVKVGEYLILGEI